MSWFERSKRDLPWRHTKDPYKIWLSEVILQQTRVDQGWAYWENFIRAFPTIEILAKASEQDVLKLWQGLGYYSRARNLHHTAKVIDEELNGVFPNTYSALLKLKGVGSYTASAIASICFGEARPVVDGNVFRFVSRYFGIEKDIAKSKTRVVFEEHLKKYIAHDAPGTFNQAMMEFGAMVCTPKTNCVPCLFQQTCYAFQNDAVNALPLKNHTIKVKKRYLNYIVFHSDSHILLKERTAKDIWKGLYDFHLVEGNLDEEEILKSIARLTSTGRIEISQTHHHLLSHQKLYVVFYAVSVCNDDLKQISSKQNLKMLKHSDALVLPKSKLIVNYLSEFQPICQA